MDIAAGADGHAQGGCLNCGTALIGHYCYECGQSAHVHRTVGAIWHDLLHGAFHFEGQVWRTLPMLVARPGELTRRYVHGERARFVSPIALFLFSVFAMFTTLSILGIAPPAELPGAGSARAGLEQALKDNAHERQETTEDLAKLAPADTRRAALTRSLARLDADRASLTKAVSALPEPGAMLTEVHTGWHRLDHGIEKAKKNPGLMLYKLQANSYKFSWALIPLSVPFVWLLFFWRRDLHGYDHAVFVTYSIAFMSLLFIVVTVASTLGVPGNVIQWAALLIPPAHIFVQMRGAYRLRKRSAILRTAVLVCAFIPVVATLFVVLLLGLGLVG
jgi:hypothetical protein